ncbi:MAG: hypothetical protein KatS3mg010_1897 [Acidimicrobiia bacterium]|nr:MAG: hypothetical protein KatS3mg010_1897 [Acidimicrobiia bacterium]
MVLVSAATYGQQRFRIAAEPVVLVAAAVALVAAAGASGRHRAEEPGSAGVGR